MAKIGQNGDFEGLYMQGAKFTGFLENWVQNGPFWVQIGLFLSKIGHFGPKMGYFGPIFGQKWSKNKVFHGSFVIENC